MYQEFFGLSDNPFRLSPDPCFMFSTEKTKVVLASISDAIRERKGFVVMTGEVGTGKTLVLRCLVEMWEREEIPFAYFIGPRLSSVDFLSYITFELGINVAEPTKGNLLRALYGFLLAQFEKGLTTVLIIDEAHQMPRSVLEEIRVLANFETAQQKLIQIILVGQPELDKKLDSVELRSLKQRIAVRCQLEPLRGDEVHHYIERRLALAGADIETTPIFPLETIKAIYRYSLGIPRLVNSICDQALIAAYERQVRTVPVEIIKEVAVHFRLEPAPNLKQAERPFSLASQIEKSAPNKSWQASPALNVPGITAPDSDPNLKHLNTGNGAGTLIQTALPSKPEALPKSSHRDDPAASKRKQEQEIVSPSSVRPPRSTFLAKTETRLTPSQSATGHAVTPDQIVRDPWPSQTRRWVGSKLRWSLIITIAVGVLVSLASGVLMARHQKGPVPAPYRAASTKESFLGGPTAASMLMQPAQASSALKISSGSVPPTIPAAGVESVKSLGELEHFTPPTKVVAGTLSRPILRTRPTSIEPPPIMETQTKELDPAEQSALLGMTSAPNPTTLPPPGIKANASVPVPVGGGLIKEPRLLTRVLPDYPKVARQTHTEGDVVLEIVVDKSGNVSATKAVSGPSNLRQSALDAVRHWKYEPSLLDGEPTPVQMMVTIRFRL